MISYEGRPTWKTKRGGPMVVAVEDGVERALDPRLDLANHSPTGFGWGYNGSGPAQTALAILADYFAKRPESDIDRLLAVMKIEKSEEGPPVLEKLSWRDYIAVCLHQAFKFRVIACFSNGDRFWLTSDDVGEHVSAIAEATGKAGRWA